MDVRCEKCHTEYELDESRLKPTGVTVKCTNCGHMFKIRKKGSTNLGPMAPNPMSVVAALPRAKPSTLPPPSPTSAVRPGPSATRPSRESAQVTNVEARTWLLRLENGESRSCKELAMLQQWILAGTVTRESLISRNGKTWKRLGDIAELGSYFASSDDAKASRSRGAGPATLIGVGSGAGAQTTEVDLSAYASAATGGTKLPLPGDLARHNYGDDQPIIESEQEDQDLIATAERPSPAFSTPPPLPSPRVTAAPPVTPVAVVRETTERNPSPPAPGRTGPARRPTTQPPPPPGAVLAMTAGVSAEKSSGYTGTPKGQETAGFSGKVGAISNEPAFTNAPNSGRVQRTSSGSSGPSAGASFAGKIRTEPGSDDVFRNSPNLVEDDETGPVHAPRSSSAGKWIAIVALLAIGGAAAAIYFVALRPSLSTKPANGSAASVLLGSGSSAGSDSTAVALAVDAPGPAISPVAEAVSAASADLSGDLTDRLRSRSEALAKLAGADATSPLLLATRARVATALAQQLDDQAALAATPTAAEPFRKQSKELVNTAIGWATKAAKQAPTEHQAMLAMADLLRLQGKPSKEVRKYLNATAIAGQPLAVDFAYIDALLIARDGKVADARKALLALDQGAARLEQSGDVRVRFRQAMLAFADGKPVEARQFLDTVLASQGAHEGAIALLAKLDAAVNTADPLPPEVVGSGSGTTTTTGTGAGSNTTAVVTNTNTTGVGGEDYDRLVKRANELAESNCSKASELFNKALDQKPNGVEALVGVGFCSLDSKNYATAFSKFRAALAISPRNERALWGVAETYQQQSRKEQAIESYQRYLEVYPDSSAAKRQLERLGVTNDTPKDPPKDPTPTPTPTPVDSPAPTGQPTKPPE